MAFVLILFIQSTTFKKFIFSFHRQNDNPHGIFYLPKSQQYFNVNATSLERSTTVTVARRVGTFGTCRVSVVISHSNTPSVTRNIDVIDGVRENSLKILIPTNSFLPFGSSYTIKIFSVSLVNSNLKPSLNDTEIVLPVPEIGANSVVTVAENSRYVMVDSTYQTAFVTVARVGLYGRITVPWQSGYPATMINKPDRSKGDIDPPAGVLEMKHGERTRVFTFKALAEENPGKSLDYVVHLDQNLEPSQNQNGWPKLGDITYSIIEPHGVVRISPSTQNIFVLEGNTVQVNIVRTFSTVGTIRVEYQTKMFVGDNPAISGSDFVSIRSTIDFSEGEFLKTIDIQTLDDTQNPQPEQQERFLVELISVNVLTERKHAQSPRLGSELVATVTILDNDNPFGTFSFAADSRSLVVDESSGSIPLTIERNGGALSQSAVDIFTLGGDESWTDDVIAKLSSNHPVKSVLDEIKDSATGNTDYGSFRRLVTFEKKSASVKFDRKQIAVNIFTDNENEPLEKFIIFLFNATGGAIIFQPHSYAVVSIRANGYYNGAVGFDKLSGVLNEDEESSLDVVVLRTGQMKESINVGIFTLQHVCFNLVES